MNHRRCVLNRDKNNNVVKAVKKVAQGPARDEVFGLSQKLQLSAQDYGRRLENLVTSLQGHNQQKDTILRDYENLEAWC